MTNDVIDMARVGTGRLPNTETGVTGWQLTDIDCQATSGSANAANESLAGTGGQTDITVDPGDVTE